MRVRPNRNANYFVQPPPASVPPPSPQSSAVKLPRPIFDGVYAFPPNRETLGGTAYFIVGSLSEETGNVLIDAPAWNETNQAFLQAQGGVRWFFLTHRSAIAKVREIQQTFGCEVLIQEQEAYLLPGLTVTPFEQAFALSDRQQVIWTPGHSPGSACLYDKQGGMLFSGRHLLPNAEGNPTPLRIAKTFHWRRQLQSVRRLLEQFTPETLKFICPGANTGFLRGQPAIDRAYERLAQLDLDALAQAKPLL